MPQPTLAIQRLSLTVEASSSDASPAAETARSAIKEYLPGELAIRLPDADGDPLLLLRKVEVDIDVGATAGARQIAARLAEAIAAAIGCAAARTAKSEAETFARGSADAIPRFDSPAARVAAFIAALTEGRTCHPWWFGRFEGVRLLPPSAAIRTVLLRDPAAIGKVFESLDAATRLRLGARLGEADAALLLEALAALPCDAPASADWTALASALRRASAREPLARAVESLALLALDRPSRIGGAIAAAAGPAALRLAAQDRPRSRGQASRSLARSTGPVGATAKPRGRLPLELQAALAATARSASAEPSPDAPMFSPFGGYALLLPALLEFDLEARSRDWPTLAGTGPAQLLQLLVLSAAAGGPVLQDPFWRLVLGVPTRLATADLADWLAAAPALRRSGPAIPAAPSGAALPRGLGRPATRRSVAGLAAAVLSRFAARLPGFAGASPAFLRSNLLGAGATVRQLEGDLHIRLERPPLDVLLSMTGAADRELGLPDGRRVRLERRR